MLHNSALLAKVVRDLGLLRLALHDDKVVHECGLFELGFLGLGAGPFDIPQSNDNRAKSGDVMPSRSALKGLIRTKHVQHTFIQEGALPLEQSQVHVASDPISLPHEVDEPYSSCRIIPIHRQATIPHRNKSELHTDPSPGQVRASLT